MHTIVVVDDHQIIRQGLCALLKTQEELQVIGDVGDGESAIRLAEQFHPDVMVIDMVMPGMNGLEITRRVRQCSPASAIIILSMYGAEGYVQEAIKAGAQGYVLKKDSVEELATAIREVVGGRQYISPYLMKRAIDSFVGTSNCENNRRQPLTIREREIITMVAAGSTSAQIAAKLFISSRTVEFHRANIMRKLGLHTQQELTRYCIETGLLPPQDI